MRVLTNDELELVYDTFILPRLPSIHIKEFKKDEDGKFHLSKYLSIARHIKELEIPLANNNYCIDANDGVLTSLKNFPLVVENVYIRNQKNLVTLNSPVTYATGNFLIRGCENLTSIENCPERVDRDFSLWNLPKLISLKGAPQRVRDIIIFETGVKSLEFLPTVVKDTVYIASSQQIDTLRNIYKTCRSVNNGNPGGVLNFRPSKEFEENAPELLGLLRIVGLTRVQVSYCSIECYKAVEILNKYLSSPKRDMLGCQEEMMKEGLDKFAGIS